MPDPERDDGQPGRLAAAEDLDSRAAGPAAQHVLPEPLLAGGDEIGADCLLECHDEPGADGLDDGGGAAFLACDRVVEIAVADRVDERHRAAAGRCRHLIADQFAPDDQDAGGLRPAGELVRRQEDRVLVVVPVRPGFRDADGHVGTRSGIIPGRRAPACDVFSRDGDLLVQLDLPGIDAEKDVRVTLRDGCCASAASAARPAAAMAATTGGIGATARSSGDSRCLRSDGRGHHRQLPRRGARGGRAGGRAARRAQADPGQRRRRHDGPHRVRARGLTMTQAAGGPKCRRRPEFR